MSRRRKMILQKGLEKITNSWIMLMVASVMGLTCQPASAVKPTPPVKVSLEFQSQPVPGSESPVEFKITPMAGLGNIVIEMTASGVASMGTFALVQPGSLRRGDIFSQRIPVRVGDSGPGTISVTISATDEYGLSFKQTETLYIIVDVGGVGTGKQGFSFLDRQRLEELKVRGLITPEFYNQKLRRLLGGGATETNEPSKEQRLRDSDRPNGGKP